GVRAPQEEDLAGELLPDHLREIRRAVAGVERAHVGVGLLELRVLAAGDRQVAHDVQAVSAARRPAVHPGDDDLGHRADESLHLEDVKTPSLCPNPGSVNGLRSLTLGVLVAAAPPDALVPAGAERPAAVLGSGAVAGQQDSPDIGRHARVVQRAIQLVDGVRAEGVANLGAVEGDSHRALRGPLQNCPVVGDVGQVETLHDGPRSRVEDLTDALFAHVSEDRPMSLRWYSVVIDCHDVAAQARWWAGVLGWQIVFEADDEVVIVPGHVTEEWL